MGKRGRLPTAARDERRAAILEVAVELFRELGYARTTIEAIALQAGAAKRTLYSYFSDKPGIFAAAVEKQHSYLSQSPEGDDLASAATAIVLALHGDNAIALHRTVIGEASQFPRLAAAFYAHGPARAIGFLADRLRDEFGDEAAALSEPLYTLLLGEEHRRRLLGLAAAPDRAEARRHANRAIDIVLGASIPSAKAGGVRR